MASIKKTFPAKIRIICLSYVSHNMILKYSENNNKICLACKCFLHSTFRLYREELK